MASLPFTVDGVAYKGTALLPRKPTTLLSFQLPKNPYLLFINTCAREEFYDKDLPPIFHYKYTPGQYKENVGSCAMFVTVVTTSGEYHRAVIDFTNLTGKETSAKVFCNKWVDATQGVALCQVRAGYPITVQFDTPFIYAFQSPCLEPKCVGVCEEKNKVIIGYEFDIKTVKGICAYDFLNKEGKTFRLSVLGYTSVLNVFPPPITK
jgi:hypothetical protein